MYITAHKYSEMKWAIQVIETRIHYLAIKNKKIF